MLILREKRTVVPDPFPPSVLSVRFHKNNVDNCERPLRPLNLALIKKNQQLHSRTQYWNDEAAPANGGFVDKAIYWTTLTPTVKHLGPGRWMDSGGWYQHVNVKPELLNCHGSGMVSILSGSEFRSFF